MRTTILVILALALYWALANYLAEVSGLAHASEWNYATHEKHRKLVKAGIEKEVAKHLIDACKATAKDPVNCIKLGASVLGAESSGGTNCYRNNCVGMNDGSVAYESKKQ